MSARTPYWPLFRNEVGIDHYHRVPWGVGLGFYLALWVACSFLPLLILFRTCEGELATFFTAFGSLFSFAPVWWLAMAGWLFSFAVLPGISNPIESVRTFEFLFSRAIDRRRVFRVRAAVIYAVMLGPLVINLIVSSALPAPTFGLDGSAPASATFRREQYFKAFPDSHLREGARQNQPAPLIIPGGAVALTGWILWMGMLGLVLMQGYSVVVARHVQHSPWLAGAAMSAPVIASFLLAPWISRLYPNVFEEVFLHFSRNFGPLMAVTLVLWALLQAYSERRFRELEIH